MKKFFKTVLIILGTLIAVVGLVALTSVIVHESMTKVSQKATDIRFSDDAKEVKAFFGDPVWSDEFNDGEVDLKNWEYSGHTLHRNNELQYYVDDANDGSVTFEDGSLVMRADKLDEPRYGYDYSSVSLVTQKKQLFRYGYFEMRAVLPDGQGLWPAFWLLGQVPYIPAIKNEAIWPLAGEIDIMEAIGAKEDNNTCHGDLHWVNNLKEYFNWRKSGFKDCYDGEDFTAFVLPEGTFETTGFHTFGFGWNDKEMVWYVDDVAYMREDITGEEYDCFRSKGWYILINLAVGGNWPGSPDETTAFPAEFRIDYIRVYQ